MEMTNLKLPEEHEEKKPLTRAEKRRIKKTENKIIEWHCPNKWCGYVTFGGPTATFYTDEKGKKLARMHRQCPKCGTNMVKTNIAKR